MKLLFISLGCDKNLVDSEYMIGMLANDGIEMTDDETQADIIIVNSCCFIGDAKEESINTILEMAQYKETGKCKSLIVTGCLAQRYKDEIFKEIPEVDAILGTIYCMIEFSLFLSLAGFGGEITDVILCFLNFVSFSLDKCHICIII